MASRPTAGAQGRARGGLALLLLLDTAALLWLGWRARLGIVAGRATYLVALLWLATAALLVVRARRHDAARAPGPARRRGDALRAALGDPVCLAAGAILLLGFVFRSAELDHLPWGWAGAHLDAIYNSLIAFRLLDGDQGFVPVVHPLFPVPYARDVLIHYYLAAFYGLLGRSIETLRLACNVLGIFTAFLLFLILRRYTTSVVAVLGATALCAFSGTDAIMMQSALEYVVVNPVLLGSFLLFTRAMRTGRALDATLAGLVWGIGFSSHYSYLYIGLAVPAVALLHLGAVRPWLPRFAIAAFVAALPKLAYLPLNYQTFLVRFFEVARHDAEARFFVPAFFRASLRELAILLFQTGSNFKNLLPDPPLIPLASVPLLLLGYGAVIRRWRHPVHVLVLVVTATSVAVNLGTYVQDYRWINFMPALFLLLGIGLAVLARWLGDTPRGHVVLGTVVGLLLLRSAALYFGRANSAPLRLRYGTQQVALGRALAKLRPGAVYFLGPEQDFRVDFFNVDQPLVGQLTYTIDWATREHYSRETEATIFRNLDDILARAAEAGTAVYFVVSPRSPYGPSVRRYLATLGARATSLEVTDPVALTTARYYLSVVSPRALSERPPATPPERLAAAAVEPPAEARGTLHLTRFTDTEQSLVLEERRVPARLDFDFVSTVPYAGEWGNDFALRWSGWVLAERTGDYRLEASFDDGCRLALDDRVLFADWQAGAVRTRSVVVSLERGWHGFRLDYFQLVYQAHLSFRMAPVPDEPVPPPPDLFASSPQVLSRAP